MKLLYQRFLFPPAPTPTPKRRGWIKRRDANAIEFCLRIGRKLHMFALVKSA